MPILNTFSGSGGGIRIPLEAPTSLLLAERDGSVLITWTDPVDKVATPGGETVAEWNYSVVVRNVERYPVNPKDGTEIVRTTSRNQYQSTAYTDSLYIENGVTYYYAVFAVTTIGVVSESIKGTATPTAATPEYSQYIDLEGSMDYDAVISATENHFMLVGGLSDNIVTFNSSLTKGTLAKYNVIECTPIQFGGNAVFIGGRSIASTGTENPISGGKRYNASLTASTLSFNNGTGATVNGSRDSVGVGASEEHLILVGGAGSSYDSYATAFNTTFTRQTLQNLEEGASEYLGASAGNTVIFVGGESYDSGSARATNAPDIAYNSSLTRMPVPNGPYVRSYIYQTPNSYGVASSELYAFFAGGENYSGDATRQITVYNESITRLPQLNLRAACEDPAGGCVDGFVMFAHQTFGVDCFDNSLTRLPGLTYPTVSTDLQYSQESGTVGNSLMFLTHDNWGNPEGVAVYQCV